MSVRTSHRLGHVALMCAASLLVSIACTRQHLPRVSRSEPTPQPQPSPTTPPIPPPPTEETLPLDSLRWPEVQEEALPSGVTLRWVSTPVVPLLHVRVVFPVGRSAEVDRPGVARLTALTLLEGAMGADAPTGRAYGLERVATPSVHVRHDATIFGLTVTTTDVDVAIDRLRDMLLQPGFRLSAFQRAQQLAPRLIAADRFTTGLEGALYAVPGAEDERALGELEAWHCRAFHKATYDLHRATVVWVGDITLPQARKLTERLVSGSSSKPTANAVAPVPPAAGLDLKHEGRMHVAVVTKGPARSHEDWPALWLVAQSMTKSCPALPWASPVESFRICDTVASSEVDAWKRSVESQLVAIGRDGLERALLETAKRRLIEEEAVRLRSPDALADTLTRWSLSDVDVVGDRVRDVTDVRDAVVRHLAPEHLRFVAVPVTEDGRSSADSSP